jgi:tRNA1Val (adenine37-N6)-methyltransferase
MTSSTSKTKGFQFKQFTILDGHSGMPVSTDGVLLGAWAQYTNAERLLDIGTGTGLLALMGAQRFQHAAITAIDIDSTAINDAKRNFAATEWGARLTLLQGDVLKQSFSERFTGIICNPPYFNSGEVSHNAQRATARHTHTLAHEQLLQRCHSLLTEEGQASFVLPTPEGEQFIAMAKQQGWFLTRLCRVQTTPKKSCHRLLFTLSKVFEACKEDHLVIHGDVGGYSADFITLTKDFYLKM